MDLQVLRLQSWIQRLRKFYIVGPFNTLLFFFHNILTVGEVYYQLYVDDYEMASKVAFDPEEPSLGRIQADSVAPPHSPASIKRCISRVEGTPELAHADLFADISCKTPIKEGHISTLHTDGLGLSLNEPMAIVLTPIVQVQSPSIPDGKYIIKNRARDIFWCAGDNPISTVCFWPGTMVQAMDSDVLPLQVKMHSPIIQVFTKVNSLL